MANNIYIGMRYVPIFLGDYDANTAYEALSIVGYNGATYTSKQAVPAGILPTNTTYWAKTSDFNAQYNELNTRLTEVEGDVDTALETANAASDAVEALDSDVDTRIATAIAAITGELEGYGVCNVKDFGATGDGVNDDYASIMSALNDTRFSIYYFPKGTYKISGRVSIPREGITLIGETGAVIYADTTTYSMIEVTYSNIVIFNLEITMNVARGRNEERSSCILVHNTHANYTAQNLLISHCYIHNANRYGINLETASDRPFNDIKISNCIMHDLWVCVKNGGGMRYEEIVGCRMYNSVAEVLTFDGDVRYATLSNCWLAYNDQGVGLIGADGSSNIVITDNIFVNVNKSTNNLANGITFNRHMGVCYHYTIANNIFRDCRRAILCHAPDETYQYMGVESVIVIGNKFVSNVDDIEIEDISGRNIFKNNVSNLSSPGDRYVLNAENLIHILALSKIDERIAVPITADMMRNDATLYNDSAYNTMYVRDGKVDLSFEITSLADYTNLKEVLHLPFAPKARQGFVAFVSQTGVAVSAVVNTSSSLGFGGSAISQLVAGSRVIGHIDYPYIEW